MQNTTTGDRQTIATLTAKNSTFSKQLIKLNKKLVSALEKLATREEADKKKNINVGPVYQEATIHQKTAYARNRGTKMKLKNQIKWGDPCAHSHENNVVRAQI